MYYVVIKELNNNRYVKSAITNFKLKVKYIKIYLH